MSAEGDAASANLIIIRKVKKNGHGGHHGGAWKVAYADFVTAMMAFFMVMWIVGISDQDKRAAISEYFNNPSMSKGKSQTPAAGQSGPGGASTSMIRLGGSMDMPSARTPDGVVALNPISGGDNPKLREEQRLETLRQELLEAIGKSQALEPFKDQLFLDITSEGLRIQIVDKNNRPMFDRGSASLRGYTVGILQDLARFIASVPNRISISGHTDVTPFVSRRHYSNWELSTDRANAARRTLVAAGMPAEQVLRVVGLASTVLFDKAQPRSPINRRISIIVMNQDADDAAANADAAIGDELRPDAAGRD